MSLKAEMEVAMKLLEKESREKQDNIVSLRKQLDDIKIINLEMYKKLQVRLNSKIINIINLFVRCLYLIVVDKFGCFKYYKM